jgi:galactose-1-phosphate uridylyltransferase
MPAAAVPEPPWATGTWADTVWEEGVWGSARTPTYYYTAVVAGENRRVVVKGENRTAVVPYDPRTGNAE